METDTFIAELNHCQRTQVNSLWNEVVTRCPRAILVASAAAKPQCRSLWQSKLQTFSCLTLKLPSLMFFLLWSHSFDGY